MQLFELLQVGTKRLNEAGVEAAELDARLLLQAATGKSRTELYLSSDIAVSATQQHQYDFYLQKREKREPIAYILGEQEFWSLSFKVTPDVLIPRPETEFLLDRVLALTDIRNLQQGAILDLCCGSGIIATVMALETGRQIMAADISPLALQLTNENARRHKVVDKVTTIHGDLLSPFIGKDAIGFSLIISNPPYVSSNDVDCNLEPEVSHFEPRLALDGGERGLDLIEKIVASLPEVLLSGGQFFMEIGADQGEAVRSLLVASEKENRKCFHDIAILQDYSGRNRVVCAKRS